MESFSASFEAMLGTPAPDIDNPQLADFWNRPVSELAALAGQDYDGDWELIVCDDGSRDGTLERVRQWRPRLPHARLVDRSAGNGRGPGGARNAAVRLARGEFLAFCDGDDVVTPGWLSAMARGARWGDIVVGRLDHLTLNPPPIRSWRETAPPSDEAADRVRRRVRSVRTLGLSPEVGQAAAAPPGRPAGASGGPVAGGTSSCPSRERIRRIPQNRTANTTSVISNTAR